MDQQKILKERVAFKASKPKTIELIDSPGFDFYDIKDPENIFSQINFRVNFIYDSWRYKQK